MYRCYTLTMHVERLVGGIPRHPEIVKRWQEARFPRDKSKLGNGDPQTPGEAADRTVDTLGDQAITDEDVEGIWTGFMEYPGGGIAIEGRQVKAMLKESANVLKALLPVRGKPIPLRARLAERVFVLDRFILVGDEPTGTVERAIHVMTAQGPRTALKRTDYVDDAVVVCTLKVLDDGIINDERLTAILDHASLNGLGTDRSQGNGTFTYDLAKVDCP